MTNLLLKVLRSRGIVLDGVVPFARNELVHSMTERHPDKVVIQVPEDARPGPYWLMSKDDAVRMEAAGYKRAIDVEAGGGDAPATSP